MAHNIPAGFISLADTRDVPLHSLLNVIGVVVDVMPPAPTRKGQYMITFKLMDLKLADAIGGREGFTIRFFDRNEEDLPRVKNVGDVVQLRQIKIMPINGQRLGLSNFQTRTIVVPSASIPTPAFSIGYQDKNRIEGIGKPQALQDFGLREQAYMIALRHSAGMLSIIEERLARMSNPLVGPASAPVPTGPVSMQRPAPTGPASMSSRFMPTGPASMASQLPAQQNKQKYVEESGSAVQPSVKRPRLTRSFGPKFKLVENLQPRTFADLCGEVVKMYPAQWGCDFYITDYTSNDQMRYYPKPDEETDQERDGDTFGYTGPPKREWPGPYGWLVLKVNLKYPHADYASKYVKQGDYVLLSNVKGNISRDGSSRLEGDLWAEYDNPEKLKILKLTDPSIPEIRALRQRKEEYWASSGAQPPQGEGDATESKAKKKEAAKKLKKQERRAAQAARRADEAAALEKKSLNRHVRCTHEDIPITKVVDILDLQNTNHINSAPDGRDYILPFINVKYRAKVRVVDYEPKDLEDFAIRPELEHDSDDPDSMDWMNASPSYEWYFSLLLEDASVPQSVPAEERHRLWVQVHHQSAQFLLNRLADPEDLQHNSALLRELREKLFLLWGNLEENGGEELSNLPFECVILEYGIPMEEDDALREATSNGWKRMYAMEGASIL
ncbi:uncharacterized protein RCC_04579 [Ramularia collo-cygni]|uniref:Protection of telomeres protein 1 n=1 Tax=Ramularia collo-cygni TaxID=112498 RepID=A0A2D3UWR6_9PEZI|nr:uncharacterized protein RCC_04579 [Ramularia collo-cygni]CZT18735.1 uncharacterized protein RCC_04579 [Ramularia collo-cygni]